MEFSWVLDQAHRAAPTLNLTTARAPKFCLAPLRMVMVLANGRVGTWSIARSSRACHGLDVAEIPAFHRPFRYNRPTVLARCIVDIIDTIKDQIANNPVLLYMKGSPNAPQCGFSSRAAQVLMACGEKFAYVDILQNPEIRANLPKYANWPTFPQLWVGGELVGGSDILAELYEKGELQTLIKQAVETKDA